MKLTNEVILNSSSKLSDLSQREFPVKVSYALSKNITKLNAELVIYNSERAKLIEKYSIKDEGGKTLEENGQINIQPECLEGWNKDIRELLAIENEIDIHQFSIEALNDYSMSANDLMVIDYMIAE